MPSRLSVGLGVNMFDMRLYNFYIKPRFKLKNELRLWLKPNNSYQRTGLACVRLTTNNANIVVVLKQHTRYGRMVQKCLSDVLWSHYGS